MQSSIKDWCASKLTTTYKMTLMYLLVIIHINNQSILNKVNRLVIRVQYTNCLSISFIVLCSCGSALSKEKEGLESLCKVWLKFLDKDIRDRSYWTADLFTWPSKLLRCLMKVPCSSKPLKDRPFIAKVKLRHLSSTLWFVVRSWCYTTYTLAHHTHSQGKVLPNTIIYGPKSKTCER